MGPFSSSRRLRNFAAGFATLVVLASAAVQAAELRGVVEEVAGLEVWIRLDGALLPRVGDPVDLSFSLPDGEELSLGSWTVTDVVGSLVRASVVEHSGRPARGHRALIRTDETLAKQRPDPPVAGAPAGPSGEEGPEAVVSELLAKLEDPQPKAVQHAAKALYHHHRNQQAVQEEADRVLRAEYNAAPSDPYAVDALSYLCNSLGRSGDRRYAATLSDVARNARSKKLRKYAGANLERLQ